MTIARKSLTCIGAAVLAVGFVGEAAIAARAATGGEKVIAVSAMKFQYIPAIIKLKKDEPVIIELSSLDRRHGFFIPELGLRADVLPDSPVRVRIVPEKSGKFVFRCDNFCGEDHEEMEGAFVVTD